MNQPLTLLKQYFGYDAFREGQEDLIHHIIEGRDALGIMPTGGGKSICYQIPALILEGTTIVVSPLIALMKDQVDGLLLSGVEATFLNSSLSDREFNSRCQDIAAGDYKLVYVAPERLLAPSFVQMCSFMDIAMVAVDEAHCISQWGHDFRPSYGNIPRFIEALPSRPIVTAFTATATKMVTSEIIQLLELNNPYAISTGFDRKNLIYKVIKPANKLSFIKGWLKENYETSSGIIYCSTRKSVDSVATKLKQAGILAAGYHGGMSSEDRTDIQEAFMRDDIRIIVATNAFGMGIDKPDIRFVLHYNMPQNMESYYQEAGRAGRDGEISECLLMYSPADIVKQKMLITVGDRHEERIAIARENLQSLVNFCHTDDCLRKEIIHYFGEKAEFDNCGTCSNCTGVQEQIDMTVEAQKIMSCIYRMNERFGLNIVIQVLRGSKNKRVLDLGFDQLSTYGILKEMSEGALREMLMNLIARDYLYMTTDEYPILKLTNSSRAVLKGEEQVYMKQERMEAASKKSSASGKKKKKLTTGLPVDEKVYDALVEVRSQIAKEKNVPRFYIFSNATIEHMASMKPTTLEEMLEVKGVGEKKLADYGERFLEAIVSANS